MMTFGAYIGNKGGVRIMENRDFAFEKDEYIKWGGKSKITLVKQLERIVKD